MKNDIYKRLGLKKDLQKERQKFIFRINDDFKKFFIPLNLSDDFFEDELFGYPDKYGHLEVLKRVKYQLGFARSNLINYLEDNLDRNFNVFLFRLEVILDESENTEIHDKLKNIIRKAFNHTVLDLGYKFIEEQEKFIKSGDEKLDKALIEEPLKEIKNSKYSTAKKHFDDALKFYLKKDYENSVTNSYSAIDSLAKTILGKDKRVDKLKSKLLILK